MNFPIKEQKPWNPLPTMDDYLTELILEEKVPSYTSMVKVGLRWFSDYLHQVENIKAPGEIERRHIIRFQAWLAEQVKEDGTPYALSYRQKIMAYVQGWFTWLIETGELIDTPWIRIRIGRVRKKPKPLEPDAIVALFAAHKKQAFTMDPFDYHQREVILTLLYSWGLRVHELIALNVTTMDLRQNAVVVRNKGGGEKVMPYGQVEKQVVNRWLRHRARHVQRGEDALLINRRGVRISQQRIGEVISALGKRAGVEVNPHRFRDTLGTGLLDQGVPVEVAMKLLGHTNREQTMAYSRVSDPVVTRAHEQVVTEGLRQLLKF